MASILSYSSDDTKLLGTLKIDLFQRNIFKNILIRNSLDIKIK